MTQPLKIVFMGTPEFAVPSLKHLYEAGYRIAGVVTAPDKPAGRGKKLKKPEVKLFAEAKGLTILQPENLKASDFQEQLKALAPDLQVVVAFRKLPKGVWDLPAFGTFNLHASLLPDYRGAAPINWAIINGEQQTGLTTFFINDRIDEGTIIQQKPVPIAEDDTAGTLHDHLMEAGANLVKETVDVIANGEAKPKPQPEVANPKKAPKINKDTCQINWHWPLNDLYNFIRGLSPFPGAWTTFQGKQLKIFWAELIPEAHSYETGYVFTNQKNWMQVAVEGGFLSLKKLQLAGRQRMTVEEFLNGFMVPESYSFMDEASTP